MDINETVTSIVFDTKDIDKETVENKNTIAQSVNYLTFYVGTIYNRIKKFTVDLNCKDKKIFKCDYDYVVEYLQNEPEMGDVTSKGQLINGSITSLSIS